MEPANKSPVNLKRGKKDETEIEFLPDADAIERGPLPKAVRLTLHTMLLAFVCFIIWACVSPVDKIVIAHGKLVNPLAESPAMVGSNRLGAVDRKMARPLSIGPTLSASALKPPICDASRG